MDLWNDPEVHDTIKIQKLKKWVAGTYLYTKPDSGIYYSNLLLDISKKQSDPRWLGSCLSLKAMCSQLALDYQQAVNCYQQSLNIRKEMGQSRQIAAINFNLGLLHRSRAEYEEALSCFEKALKFHEKTGNASEIATIHRCLGLVKTDQELYHEAENEFLKSVEILEELQDSTYLSKVLISLGVMNYRMSNNEAARNYFYKSYNLAKQLGDEHRLHSVSLNLANVYTQLDQLDSAQYFIERSLLYEPSEHSDRARPYTSYAYILFLQEKMTKAFKMNQKGLTIRKKTKAPDIFDSYHNLTNFFLYKGDSSQQNQNKSLSQKYFDSASHYADSAIYYSELVNSTKHVSISYFLKFQAEKKAGRFTNAHSIKRKLDSLIIGEQQLVLSTFSENEKANYLKRIETYCDYFIEFGIDQMDEIPELADEAFNQTIRNKGILLRSSSALRTSILNSNDDSLIAEYKDWLVLRDNYSNAVTRGKEASGMLKKIKQKEKYLILNSPYYRKNVHIAELDWKKIQTKLFDNELVIEFVRYDPIDHVDLVSQTKKELKSSKYAALIIDSKCKHPKMIRLFEESQLEKILGTFPGNNLSYIEQVYGSKKNTKTQLYDLIWKPMEEALEGAKKVYVSPVGLLHKISFAALAKEQDIYLCDVYDIETKSSTGKIALNGENDVATTLNTKSNTTLFGGIQYDNDSTQNGIGWNYLDGSLDETQAIEKILKKQKRPYEHYTLANATEAQFKQTASESDILHIATHGFFYPDPDEVMEESIDQKESSEDLVFRGGRTGMGSNTFVKSRNPLMRSGLAFAGANEVWNQTNIKGEDGVLTAAEVATIDMRNTDLVVLSACETGLGDIKGSEGVYGLQRSFKMAGVKYLIMSLWQVPDKETAEFMTTFYKHLTKNNDIKKSFNLTQQEMRKKYDPYYWAAFILVE